MPDRTFRRLAALAAVVAGAHGLLYAPFVSSTTGTDSRTYIAAARALLDGGYTTPLEAGFYYTYPVGVFDLTGVRMGPRLGAWQVPERQAFRPPGYPAVLALAGGGGPGASRAAALGLQAVLFAAGAFLLALTVRRWWGQTPALLAAGLYALDPWSKHYVSLIMSEATAGFAALACAYAFTRAWQARAAAWWAAAGALAAALTLVRAVFVVAVPLVVLASVLGGGAARARLLRGGAALAAAAIVMLPWVAWTHAVSGRATLANWGEGYNLLLAAHGEGAERSSSEIEATPPFRRDLAAVRTSFPSRASLRRDPEAHPRYLARADAELRDRALERYGERLGDEPLSVAGETLYRALFLWSVHEDWYQPGGAASWALRLLDWITIALALAGAVVAVRRGGPARALVLFLAVYTAALATHHVEARFSMPLRGLELALVALALVETRRVLVARGRD